MKRRQLLECERLLQYVNDNESNTCHRKDDMKMTQNRVKAIKNNNRKHEIDTCENKAAHKRQFEKLTEIEVQTQLYFEKTLFSVHTDC